MMNKLKSIIIRHPTLIKLRNNLRDIIFHWYVLIDRELINERIKISNKTPEVTPRWRFLNDESNRLMYLIEDSICYCRYCRSRYKDMIYDPPTKAWFCVSCHKTRLEKIRNPFIQAQLEDQG